MGTQLKISFTPEGNAFLTNALFLVVVKAIEKAIRQAVRNNYIPIAMYSDMALRIDEGDLVVIKVSVERFPEPYQSLIDTKTVENKIRAALVELSQDATQPDLQPFFTSAAVGPISEWRIEVSKQE